MSFAAQCVCCWLPALAHALRARSASSASGGAGKSAASYFLKKKSERKSTDPPQVALQLKTGTHTGVFCDLACAALAFSPAAPVGAAVALCRRSVFLCLLVDCMPICVCDRGAWLMPRLPPFFGVLHRIAFAVCFCRRKASRFALCLLESTFNFTSHQNEYPTNKRVCLANEQTGKDLSPEQYKTLYERAVKDNQLLVKKYNEKDTEVKRLKRDLKRSAAGGGGDARMSRMSRRRYANLIIALFLFCFLFCFFSLAISTYSGLLFRSTGYLQCVARTENVDGHVDATWRTARQFVAIGSSMLFYNRHSNKLLMFFMNIF